MRKTLMAVAATVALGAFGFTAPASAETQAAPVKDIVTALKNGVIPADSLDSLQKSAIAMCAGATSVVGAVQDKLTAEQRGDLFANVKNIVTGKITAPEAIDSALAK